VHSVASATEELSSSVNEISRQVQASARMANRSYLVQILVPKETGKGEAVSKEWFDSKPHRRTVKERLVRHSPGPIDGDMHRVSRSAVAEFVILRHGPVLEK
jgi:hypothetical protein